MIRTGGTEEVLAQVDALMERIHVQQDAALTPTRDLYTSATQNIITLSSGGLVFSIALAQFLHPSHAAHRAGWLLPATWLMFMLAILAGTARLGFNVHVHAHRLVYLAERFKLEAPLRQLDVAAETYDKDVHQVLAEFAESHDAELASGRNYSNVASMICGGAFLGAVVLLTLYALLNVPY